MAMSHRINPVLKPVRIKALRPTQMTVGLQEVRRKRAQWHARAEAAGGKFLGTHMIPVVLGPGKTDWLIDHHHLARALLDEGVEDVLVAVVGDLSSLTKSRFFAFMDCHDWLHPYDAEGCRREWKDLPRHVGKLVDDPYRSLAGEVRRAGGYAKNPAPYSEFLWADFFRDRIKRSHVEEKFGKALAKAVTLARSPAAAYLPGFSGPSESD